MRANSKLKMVEVRVRLFASFVMVAAFAIAFAGCDGSLLLPGGGDEGDEDGLVVPITRMYFGRNRLASTLGSGDTVELGPWLLPELDEPLGRLQIFPPHHTMPLEGEDRVIEWISSDEAVATVDDEGTVTFRLGAMRPDVDGIFAEATITARFRHNRSVFAEMPVIVIPHFPAERAVNFRWGQWESPPWWDGQDPIPQQVNLTSNPTVVRLMDEMGFQTINIEGDRDLGDGIILRTGTGALNNEEMARGTAGLGLDTDRDDPNPWLHSTAFLIDPEEPYMNSPRPTGSPVSWGSLHADTNPLNLNDPQVSNPIVNTFTQHLRTGGSGWRLFEVLGLQRPFVIEVVYTTNDAGSGRAAGIRFGNDFWVEGPLGFETANNPPSPNPQLPPLRVVRFEYRDFVYSYGLGGERYWVLANGARIRQAGFVEDPYNPRVPLEDFQPSVYVDVSAPGGPGGLRIYSFSVRPLLDADGDLDWGERPPEEN